VSIYDSPEVPMYVDQNLGPERRNSMHYYYATQKDP
jgi:hypothetical protein